MAKKKYRSKTTERKYFSKEEKYEVLEKSKGRCSHCGKKISVGSGFTMEHVVPIAQGGTNDIANLVALCKDCNAEKADSIYNPSTYYPYLKSFYRKKVVENFDSFCEDINFISKRNLLYADEELVEVRFVKNSFNQKMTMLSKSKPMVFKSKIEKAFYNDLDDVYNFCKEYYRYFNKNMNIKSFISTYFSEGCIYLLKSGGEIICVLFCGFSSLVKVDEYESLNNGYSNKYCLNILPLIKPDVELFYEKGCDSGNIKLISKRITTSVLNILYSVLDNAEVKVTCSISWYDWDIRVLRLFIGEDDKYNGTCMYYCDELCYSGFFLSRRNGRYRYT